MIAKTAIAFGLVSICVAIHAMGLVAALRWFQERMERGTQRFWRAAWLMIRIAAWTLLLHLLQIAAWAFVYALDQALPDMASALYFSAVTYTTTGYGDLLLPEEWRLVGGVEALTGILMCGLSTGLFFAVFAKVFGIHHDGASKD